MKTITTLDEARAEVARLQRELAAISERQAQTEAMLRELTVAFAERGSLSNAEYCRIVALTRYAPQSPTKSA
jgi:hypothetical protein